MATLEQVKEALKIHKTREKAARALKIGEKTLRKLLRENKTGSVRTLQDFKKEYDKNTIIPERIKEAIKTLGSGNWVYEVEFAKLAKISLRDLGHFKDQFSDLHFQLPNNRRVWAGSSKTIEAMKEMV